MVEEGRRGGCLTFWAAAFWYCAGLATAALIWFMG